jgi:hypothetical protein
LLKKLLQTAGHLPLIGLLGLRALGFGAGLSGPALRLRALTQESPCAEAGRLNNRPASFSTPNAYVGRIHDGRRCWAPLPLRPCVGPQVVREFVYAFAAVSPRDNRIASLLSPGSTPT